MMANRHALVGLGADAEAAATDPAIVTTVTAATPATHPRMRRPPIVRAYLRPPALTWSDAVLLGLGADVVGFSAGDGREGAIQGGLGAFGGGSGPIDRVTADRGGAGGGGLLVDGELVHRAGLVKRVLLGVPSLLSVVKTFLADVPGELFAVDAGLAVVQRAVCRADAHVWVAAAVIGVLFVVDARLLAVSEKLFSVPDGLLEVGEALFARELA